MIGKIESILKERFGRAAVWKEADKDYYCCHIPHDAFFQYVVNKDIPAKEGMPDSLVWEGAGSTWGYIDSAKKEHVLFFIVLDILEDENS